MRSLLTGLALWPVLAMASPFEQGEAPRVLTPARLDQPVSEVPASVTVIDRELILASGAGNSTR
ncbi:hypothetical protein HML84_19575 [Alcanivorax sp. IO_7]|nr:hypothetical protein HML84_19575 [Alcanivorax sp. IO_7]